MNTENTDIETEQINSSATTPNPSQDKRKKRLVALIVIFCIAGLIYGIYWLIFQSKHETTDNAYVQGNVVQITSQIPGTVSSILVNDTDFVRAGQQLVKLDSADSDVALRQARAQLAQAVREVRTLYANNATFKANISLREAEITRAKSELARAREDLRRRRSIMSSGAVSKEEIQHAEANLIAAQSAEAAAVAASLSAKEQLTSNKSLTDNINVEEHPNVLRAAAQFREAFINAQRNVLISPVSGYVARRSVQLGQRIPAGSPLMAVIPMDQVWVDANFKEVQLRKLRIGQPATLISDAYGKDVTFHGTVTGLGAGTGAAFALLPAQNATGNWIKVVQRVPVRIQLEPKELANHPLRIGLSMEVDVEVADQSGKTIPDATRAEKAALNDSASNDSALNNSYVTMFDSAALDAEIHQIITSNLGEKNLNKPAKANSAD